MWFLLLYVLLKTIDNVEKGAVIRLNRIVVLIYVFCDLCLKILQLELGAY